MVYHITNIDLQEVIENHFSLENNGISKLKERPHKVKIFNKKEHIATVRWTLYSY